MQDFVQKRYFGANENVWPPKLAAKISHDHSCPSRSLTVSQVATAHLVSQTLASQARFFRAYTD